MGASAPIAERLLDGDRAALARLISWAENADPRYPEALSKIYPHTGRAWRIGITGPPGAGKSSLTAELVASIRQRDERCAVLAIDPSSPFTGGALLGDRIRMEERTADPGVYIRSMASRESHGGLARAAADALDVMDAFGFERLIIETVGVGQAEYDVVGAADTVCVVLCPGAGDGIQAMKAGLLEVADILVVNKSDLEGADQLVLDLEDAQRLRRSPVKVGQGGEDASRGSWKVPVVATSATRREGFAPLLEAIEAHRRSLEGEELALTRRRKRVAQVRRVVREDLEKRLWDPAERTAEVLHLLEEGCTPYDIAGHILDSVLGTRPGHPTHE